MANVIFARYLIAKDVTLLYLLARFVQVHSSLIVMELNVYAHEANQATVQAAAATAKSTTANPVPAHKHIPATNASLHSISSIPD